MSFESDAGYVPDTTGFAVFFLLKVGDADNWVRFWSGYGDFDLPADTTDTAGGRYRGLGFPIEMPTLARVLNGAFDNVDFVLSGVDPTAIRLLNAERDQVDGAMVYVGVVDLDSAQQAVSSVDWLTEAVAGKPRASRQGQGEGAVLSITLPCSTAFYDRNQTALSYWSPNGQRQRSGDDAFADGTPQIEVSMVVAWPT